ncbi:formylglycine-generating enzyme family protein [Nannocystis sp. SCPEA4]|uniref:formylglycine-generating enzyme family protein n=1 Tax=Nannocystis sp. SCPEA4 TaxID=2996787 RepID=UPI00226DCE01|nr:formylglycine-generating enzyme family protein [Nannocystis sp. SCPEA4]MCY1058864.1 formylglycine-generating enzyme family protein [Nannocystis sp. SCPEA4]
MTQQLNEAYIELAGFLDRTFSRLELEQALTLVDNEAGKYLPERDRALVGEWITAYCLRLRHISTHDVPSAKYWAELRKRRPQRTGEIAAIERKFQALLPQSAGNVVSAPTVSSGLVTIACIFALCGFIAFMLTWGKEPGEKDAEVGSGATVESEPAAGGRPSVESGPRVENRPTVESGRAVGSGRNKGDGQKGNGGSVAPTQTGSTPPLPKATSALAALGGAMKFMHIPGGSYTRGSTREDIEAFVPESLRAKQEGAEPRATAHVASFDIATTEVTQGQWQEVMSTAPRMDKALPNGPKYPVYYVSWFEAVEFANQLTEHENKTSAVKMTPCYVEVSKRRWLWDNVECTGYRLPTETEWEYAARAGTSTAFSFNSPNEVCNHANFGDISYVDGTAFNPGKEPFVSGVSCSDRQGTLAEVAQYEPNAFNLYDMFGNVYEWTWDRWTVDIPATLKVGYRGPDATTQPVFKGGAYNSELFKLRPAYRSAQKGFKLAPGLGFRVVRAPLDVDSPSQSGSAYGGVVGCEGPVREGESCVGGLLGRKAPETEAKVEEFKGDTKIVKGSDGQTTYIFNSSVKSMTLGPSQAAEDGRR